MHTAESNFSNFVIEYLGKIETEFENALACLSGAHENHEKTWRWKILRHTPFKWQNSNKYDLLFLSSSCLSMVSALQLSGIGRVGHRFLFRSECIGLLRSFKECNLLLCSFFEFLATYKTQKTMHSFAFFS